MLKYEDPRSKKRKKHNAATTPKNHGLSTPRDDRFGEKADFSTSYIKPEPSVGGDSEMVRSVRSDPKGHAPRDGGVVSGR